jgi:SEC-C motif-containing protein
MTKRCCGPILAGQPAPSPEALMRSRYAAYATSSVGHIIATTHPTSAQEVADLVLWRAEIASFCAGAEFVSLTIHDAGEDGNRGWVHFTAELRVSGATRLMSEHSIFYRVGERWLYHSAQMN